MGTAVSSLAAAKEATTVPIPSRNPHNPFPDEDIRRVADLAATALIDRFTRAQRAMEALPPDADNDHAVQVFFELSRAAHDLHRVLMLGWWSDQPF